jgi:hypothetical protein
LGPDTRPRSTSQAEALELVYTTTAIYPQIIILGTGNSKNLLFFSVAIIASLQTMIVVVLFVALVNDLVSRA